MTRRRGLRGASALACVAALVVATAAPAHAMTDRWSAWAPIAGSSNDYTTRMEQRSPGFPAAAVASDSRGNVQLAAGTSTYLRATTPPGAKYGSSLGSPYLVLRPRADTPTAPSTTTYSFDHPTPDTGWGFVLGDVDADQVRVRATAADGSAVPAADIDGWFQGTFNHAGGTDQPSWNAGTSTLTGNPAALDTDGASGWFEPDVRLSSLTFVFTRRAGFPVYQTWFVSRARPISGRVDDVSAPGRSCPVEDAVLTLVSPYGEKLATTRPAADGSYDLGEFATQDGYVVRLTPPATCAAFGAVEDVVDNRGNDGSTDSRAEFEVREIVPQPISGTVRDADGNPVAGATVTVVRPGGGGSVPTTTGPDGTYLVDENALGTGYQVVLTVPAGYAAGPGGTTRTGIEIAATPVTGQDFVVQALPSVSGQVTGGGNGLGGVRVVLTPLGGGPAVAVVTDGDGRYSAPGLPAGGYTVAVEPPEGYDAVAARPVTVATTDVTGVDFVLPRPGAAAGTVTGPDGPVPGATVTVDGPGAPVPLTTDGEGGFYLGGLPPGSYTATVTPPDGLDVDGPAGVDFTITAAGEVVGGLDFALVAAPAEPTPSPSPSEEPSADPSPEPSTGPGESASAQPQDAAPAGATLPDTGGPRRGLLVLAGLAVAAGAALMVGSGRRLRRAAGPRSRS